MFPYSSEKYLELFDKEFGIDFLHKETPEERIEALRHKKVSFYRMRIYRAGNSLECEIFPIYHTPSGASRIKKNPTRLAQENLNHKNSRKAAARRINYNFTSRDWVLHFGFDERFTAVLTPEYAQRKARNYFRRVKRDREKDGLPPLKYFYVVEFADEYGNPARPHIHAIVLGDMEREYYEQRWDCGEYSTSRKMRTEDGGAKGLARYISKAKRHQKLWGFSKNLKMPVPTVNNSKMKKRAVKEIAIDRNTAPDIFRKMFPNYDIRDTERDLEILHSDYVAGAYIYVQMWKRQSRRKRE